MELTTHLRGEQTPWLPGTSARVVVMLPGALFDDPQIKRSPVAGIGFRAPY